MTTNRVRLPLLLAAGILLTGVFGCPVSILLPPESVLAGTWQLTPSQNLIPPVKDWLLTFDYGGQLTEVSYTVADLARFTWTNPQATVTISGDQLHISVAFMGNGFTFDGTLDSTTAPTSATGPLSADLIAGDLTVSLSQGAASLVKQ